MTDTAVSRLVVVGANHRSSSLALRDALFVEDAAVPGVLAMLRDRCGLTQAMLLSTCDRVEVMAVDADPGACGAALSRFLAEIACIDPADAAGQIYTLTGEDAVHHGFAVAASLDSQIIGEPHVLGQVKAAWRLARDAGMAGAELEAVVQGAFACAKRVRSETAIAQGPVSVASSAVQTARDLHGDLDRTRGLIVGTGDMAELMAEAFQAAGLTRLTVTAPRDTLADGLARRIDAHALPFDQLPEALRGSDVVVTAVGGRTYAITLEQVRDALRKRRQRPIFLVDAGIPGDIEPAVNREENAFLYDLDDLEHIALSGRAGREAAARAAWDVVGQEVAAFLKRRAARDAAPAITALRDHAEALRAEALAAAGGDADKATRLLVNRLLHEPSCFLRDVAERGDEDTRRAAEALLRRLFALHDDKESDR
ncbi:Glutamyl-tRNA reductase [Caenispirillum salinarum AK4]|uniref:Glutamyl-tRNA reductase n=1 Tax=Caenispirillum salinarum AK4 TaxID=1238182 RepID=K9H6F0_9PROT|nr:glutamyl-tRNA reductase [Caenispirillum salinarum]EKV26168.1 Glutamyl-tRNA reductase [Caenispirillum salinarum AK4]